MNLFEGDKSPETIPLQGFFGLGERIRTSGLLNPIQARYQTALHPDIQFMSPQHSNIDRITLTT